jgi:hypothetical protein
MSLYTHTHSLYRLNWLKSTRSSFWEIPKFIFICFALTVLPYEGSFCRLCPSNFPRVTRRPVFEWVVPSSRQIRNGTPSRPVFSNSAILFRSYMKIVRYTSIMYGRHLFAIRMRSTLNWHTHHYFLSANLNSAEKEYLEPPALFPNDNN